MGQEWNAAVLHNFDDVDYISATQGGFSDHRDFYIGGKTRINPGQSFSYRNNYNKNYHSMLLFVS